MKRRCSHAVIDVRAPRKDAIIEERSRLLRAEEGKRRETRDQGCRRGEERQPAGMCAGES